MVRRYEPGRENLEFDPRLGKFFFVYNNNCFVCVYSNSAHLGYSPELSKQTVLLEEYKTTTLDIVLHEIFHVLGRYHEHQRTDRNLHVKVHKENIEKGDLDVHTCSKRSRSLSLFLSFPLLI